MVDDVACLRPLHLVLTEPAIRDEFIHREIILSAHDGLVLEPDDHLAVVETCRFHACAKTREHRIRVEDVDCVVFRKIRNDRTEISAREVLVFLLALKVIVRNRFLLVRADLHKSLLVLDISDSVGRVGDDRPYFVLADDLADERAIKRIAASDDVVANPKMSPLVTSIDFLGFKSCKFLPSIDHDGCEDEVFLYSSPCAI